MWKLFEHCCWATRWGRAFDQSKDFRSKFVAHSQMEISQAASVGNIAQKVAPCTLRLFYFHKTCT